MTSSLYGRSAELGRLHEALAGVSSGTAALAYIEGEPGIGKSALLEEVTAHARELGFRVFAARAEELEQDRPFRSLYEAMECDAGGNGRRGEIVRLLGSGSGGEGVFYRLVDAFEDVVEAEALQGPVLLTLDDLQWADPGTVRALGSIARRMGPLPLGILATLRGEPRSEELAAFLRTTASQAVRISLRPLEESAVAEMVVARLGAAPGPKLRAHVDGAGGNAFYVAEILDALGDESLVHAGGGFVEIEGPALPPSLVLTVLRRLSALPHPVLEILRSAAVLGSSFGVDELATAAGVSGGEALGAVQTLRSHGVLADEGEKVRFRHDLIREAVYEDLGEPVRVSMHRRIGHALAAAGAAPLEVAGHLVRGAVPGDTDAAERMIEAAEELALDARTRMALIERALEIYPGHPQRSSLIRRLAWLLIFLGRPSEAIPHLQRLLSEASEIPERLELIDWLVNACFAAGRSADKRSWIKQGSQLARQLVDSDRPDILMMVARTLFHDGDTEQALTLSDRAAAVARESGSALEDGAHNQSSWLLSLLCRSGEAVARSELALSFPGPPSTKAVHGWGYACALADLDRIDEAETALAVARTLAQEEGLPPLALSIIMESAHLRYLTGRWDDALVDAETAVTILDEFEFVEPGPDPGCIISWIAYHRHDETVAERIRSLRPSFQTEDRLYPTLQAVKAFDRGDTAQASEQARELLNRIAANPPERHDFDVLPLLVRIARAAGDTTSAQLGRDTSAHRATRSDAPSVALAAARCLAIVDGDETAARHAVELARSSPRMLLAAAALEDAASVLDGDEAVQALTEALDLYGQMGAVRDQARVAARLQEFGLQAAVAPAAQHAVSGWGAITPAELEVVRLAVGGLTNREIGSRLFVSHRTVATHLSHVFDKLALRSRVELAREAANRFEDEPATG